MALIESISEKIILASASPRRKALFKLIYDKFEVIESNIDEDAVTYDRPRELVLELARRKVYKIAETLDEGIIIGADSVVALDGEILGKPKDMEDAQRMLSLLNGRCHTVFTGFSILQLPGGKYVADFEQTRVKFRKLSQWEIQRYIQIGHPLDKAGAYGIQDEAALFVESINGCYYNVMGLPIVSLFKALRPFLFNCNGDTKWLS